MLNDTFCWNIIPNLGSSISRTKCDRDNRFLSAERSIELKIPKTGFITAEPPYHAQVWNYPPWGDKLVVPIIQCDKNSALKDKFQRKI